MKKKSIRTVLITGNHLRHFEFLDIVKNNPCIDIIGYIVFKRENFIPKPPKNINNNLKEIWFKHFDLRNKFEKKFFKKKFKTELPVMNVKNINELNSKKTVKFVKSLKVNLAIIFGSEIIKNPLFSALPKYKVNFHLGLIPYFKGSITMIWPFLLLQPTMAGCTYHLIDKKVDTGEILHQVSPVLTKGSGMHETIYKTCIKAFKDFKYVANELKRRIDNNIKINHDQNLKTSGKIFKKTDFQPEHLAIIYKYYKDKIVDLYLEKKINSPKPKLIKIR